MESFQLLAFYHLFAEQINSLGDENVKISLFLSFYLEYILSSLDFMPR